LNQTELADAQVKYLSKEVIEKEKLKSLSFTGVGIEASFKTTDNNLRNNTNYEKLQIKNRFGWGIHMHQAVALFNQSILLANVPRPGFPPPPPYRTSNIKQTEYYNKVTANLNSQWQLKAAYHGVQTELDNTVYQNKSILIGAKYFNHYFDIQVDGNFSTMFDTTIQQYNAQLGIYPLGNLKLYSFSVATLSNRPNSSAFNFRQIVGGQLLKNIWIEGNVTLGSFKDLLENDAMYVYNAIDKNLFKGGVTAYITISPKCTLDIGYTLEQRELAKSTNTFNQHSITGGLSWKL
jgi:hypothetical protein